MSVMQDMRLDDPDKGRGAFCELRIDGVLGSWLGPGCAAFLLQRLLAGASDLHTDEPKGAYGLLSLMPYAPKVFLVRP